MRCPAVMMPWASKASRAPRGIIYYVIFVILLYLLPVGKCNVIGWQGVASHTNTSEVILLPCWLLFHALDDAFSTVFPSFQRLLLVLERLLCIDHPLLLSFYRCWLLYEVTGNVLHLKWCLLTQMKKVLSTCFILVFLLCMQSNNYIKNATQSY